MGADTLPGTISRVLPTSMPTITQGPVILRPFETRDVPLVMSVASDPLIPLITTVPTTGTPEDAAAFIRRQHDRLPAGAGYSFAIADAATDEAVGQIGLWVKEVEGYGRASVGYWVAPQFRRHGYAASALRALTTWAVDLDGVHRLQLFVEPWNEGSWRAAESCGYQREGLLRGWERVGAEYKDVYVYSLLPARA
jgi:ribosomal-protein-alanine N-acetyltransferase